MNDIDIEINPKKITKAVAMAAALVFAVVTLSKSCTIINPNQVGVVKTMGKISRELPRGSGLNLKAPYFQTVTKLDMSPQKRDFHFGVGTDGAITSDMQTVGVDCSIFYTFREDGIISYVSNYTPQSMDEFFKSNTKTALKAIIGKYSIYDLTAATNEISAEIRELLVSKCISLPILISDVNVSNWDWSDSFGRQIQETMARTQQEKTAKAEVQIAEAQAQKQVKEAEAKKEADLIEAEAKLAVAKKEAEAKKITADAIAYENQMIAQNIATMKATWGHEERMKYYEKWNGVEPGSNAEIITPNYSGYNLSSTGKDEPNTRPRLP